MLSKNKARFILSLQRKKIRDEENLYVIEGDKIVREFIKAGEPVITLVAKPEFISTIPEAGLDPIKEVIQVTYDELKSISTLITPHNALAVVRQPGNRPPFKEIFGKLSLALDSVQDPGNLGTIIRAAVWFNIKYIICSTDSVDVYNSKVIQATMGALLHISVIYTDLKTFLAEAEKENVAIFGTLLDGESVYDHKLDNKGIILLGNESKGISEELIPYVTEKIMIPKFSKEKNGIDSLNVGMAASIIISEFARR